MSISIDPDIDEALQRYTRLSAMLQNIGGVIHYHKKVFRVEAPSELFDLQEKVQADVQKVRNYLIARAHGNPFQ